MTRIVAALTVGLLLTASGALAQDPAQVESGRKLYASQKCAICHSIEGKGNVKGPLDGVGSRISIEDLRLWMVSPAEITAKTKATRKPPMRSYSHLAQADVDALVAYMQSLKKK